MGAMLLAWKSIEIEVILAELYQKRDIEKQISHFLKVLQNIPIGK